MNKSAVGNKLISILILFAKERYCCPKTIKNT